MLLCLLNHPAQEMKDRSSNEKKVYRKFGSKENSAEERQNSFTGSKGKLQDCPRQSQPSEAYENLWKETKGDVAYRIQHICAGVNKEKNSLNHKQVMRHFFFTNKHPLTPIQANEVMARNQIVLRSGFDGRLADCTCSNRVQI